MILRDGILFWRKNKTEMEKEDYMWRGKFIFSGESKSKKDK